MHCLAGQQPANMCPETAFARRVWIAFLVRILMMLAMSCNPENWAAFQGKRSADGQDIFHPFLCLIASMCKKPMIANAYAQPSSNPPQCHRDQECPPAKEK